jgi:hypothetical protein
VTLSISGGSPLSLRFFVVRLNSSRPFFGFLNISGSSSFFFFRGVGGMKNPGFFGVII